ncbi:MAG TPA: hypothetical protein VMU39_14540 [Solirubrobacteraceae bacterium]|nr:hypothetical protein [Solirubrobacteraceae bacterium]
MFQSSSNRWRAWLSRFEDILGDPSVDAPPHPHRLPLHWERTRRAGAVPARPAHCISPVRRTADVATTERDRAAERLS